MINVSKIFQILKFERSISYWIGANYFFFLLNALFLLPFSPPHNTTGDEKFQARNILLISQYNRDFLFALVINTFKMLDKKDITL